MIVIINTLEMILYCRTQDLIAMYLLNKSYLRVVIFYTPPFHPDNYLTHIPSAQMQEKVRTHTLQRAARVSEVVFRKMWRLYEGSGQDFTLVLPLGSITMQCRYLDMAVHRTVQRNISMRSQVCRQLWFMSGTKCA